MSETQTTPAPAEAESTFGTQEALDAAIEMYEENSEKAQWLSDNGHEVPESLISQIELAEYATRDNEHKDASGNYRAGNRWVSESQLQDHKREERYEDSHEEALKDKGYRTLTEEFVKAETVSDHTKMQDVMDALLSKLYADSEEKGWTEEQTEKFRMRIINDVPRQRKKLAAERGATEDGYTNDAESGDANTSLLDAYNKAIAAVNRALGKPESEGQITEEDITDQPEQSEDTASEEASSEANPETDDSDNEQEAKKSAWDRIKNGWLKLNTVIYNAATMNSAQKSTELEHSQEKDKKKVFAWALGGAALVTAGYVYYKYNNDPGIAEFFSDMPDISGDIPESVTSSDVPAEVVEKKVQIGGALTIEGSELGEALNTASVVVEKGEGFTHVVQDVLANNGMEGFSGSELYEIYQNNAADLANEISSYTMNNGDYGISSAGTYELSDELIKKLLDSARSIRG